MDELIIRSSYKSLEKEYDSCLSIRWSKERQRYSNNDKKQIQIYPKNSTKMVRILLDRSSFSDGDKNIISYLNKINELYPNIGIHINVEDQKCLEMAKQIMNKLKYNQDKKSIRLYPDFILKDRTEVNLSDINCTTIIPIEYAMWHDEIHKAKEQYIRFARKENCDFDGHLPFVEDEISGRDGYNDLGFDTKSL